MTIQEFLTLRLNQIKDIPKIKEYNKALVAKYPWLVDREWDPDTDTYYVREDETYLTTWLDDMPDGWRIAFSEKMCEEIQKELERTNFIDKYYIVQVKEKYGGLRWYTGGVPADSFLDEIAVKYEKLSYATCVECGKAAHWMCSGWISPYCTECRDKLIAKSNYREQDFSKI